MQALVLRFVQFLHCLKQPFLQRRQKMWLYVTECQAHPKIRVGIQNTRASLKKVRVREYLHKNMSATWERIGHVNVTTIQAEIADARLHWGTGDLLHDLRRGHKGIPRSTSALHRRRVALRG
jgi:hypothetical protein